MSLQESCFVVILALWRAPFLGQREGRELIALLAGETDGKQQGSCAPQMKRGRGKSVGHPQPWQTLGQVVGSRALIRGDDDDGKAARETKIKDQKCREKVWTWREELDTRLYPF